MESMDKFYLAGINRKINPDGTITIHCRNCGRPIMKAAGARIRTVTKCQVCILREQGVLNAEELVKPKYVTTDPTQPPVPLTAEDDIYVLYPEEAMNQGKLMPSGGVVGTAKSFFRAIGFALENLASKVPVMSKRVARRQRAGGLYEKEEE